MNELAIQELGSREVCRAELGEELISQIQNMEREELVKLQERCGLGSTFGLLVVPMRMLSPGLRTKGRSEFVMSRRLAKVPEPISELAKTVLTRLALILYLVPTGTWREKTVPSAVTFGMWLKVHAELMELAVSGSNPQGLIASRIYQNLDLGVLAQFRPEKKKRFDTEIARLRQLHAEGLWNDAPRTGQPIEFERSRLKDAAVVRTPGRSKPFEPLPDEFVAEAGWRALWIMDHLGPAAAKCATEVTRRIAELPVYDNIHTKFVHRSRVALKTLREFEWVDGNEVPITKLPFDLKLGVANIAWPPRGVRTLRKIMAMSQMAHLFIFLLSTGARIGEVLSLKPGALSIDRLSCEGRTYKLVFAAEGELREWPLPEVGARCLESQESLRLAMAELPSINKHDRVVSHDGLWIRALGNEIYSGSNEMLKQWAASLDLNIDLGHRSLHAHRFRKTIARLVALCLVGAPKILMDLFGHRTIAMTLHYILADPQIRAEAQEIARAQTVMLAKDAIEDSLNNGGPAAQRLAAAEERARVRLGGEFKAKDLTDLAEMLTLNGTAWQLVRPGVICTKIASEVGPCSKRGGSPETSKCRSNCDHRLEQGFLRDEVNRTIEEAVRNYHIAASSDDPIMMEDWSGQIFANLRRFSELEKKWMKDPTVLQLMQSRAAG